MKLPFDIDLTGKVVVVTGAGGVLCSMFAAALAKTGAKIALLDLNEQAAKDYAAYFIKVAALFSVVHAFANAAYFTIRSGGKTLITFLMDSVFVMCISVPVAFSLYYIFHLDILVAFPIVQAVDIIKVIIGMVLIKKRVWLNNIVE